DAGQGQVLDIDRENIARGTEHGVGSFADRFGDDVGREVDNIDVVAEAADHLVLAGPAVERVVPAEAVEDVGPAEPVQYVLATGAAQRILVDIATELDLGRRDRTVE